MKNRVLFIMIMAQGFVFGQNLVPNCSFELVSTCNVTNNAESLNAIELWYPINSPDFFNTCFLEPLLSPPTTWAGNSNAFSGNAFAGIGMIPGNDYREAVGIDLGGTLVKDSAYCISFYIKNPETSGYEYNTEMLSVTMGSGMINEADLENKSSQLFNETFEVDFNWTRYNSVFIANGNEDNFAIGFFGDYTYNHEASIEDDQLLYYFIDSIEVKQCYKDSVFQVNLFLPNVFTPNGDNVNDLFFAESKNIVELEVTVLNRWGNEIIRFDALQDKWDGRQSDGKMVNEGVYFAQARGIDYLGFEVKRSTFITITY